MKQLHWLLVVPSTGISQHNRLFNHYFINYNEVLNSKIGSLHKQCRAYWKSYRKSAKFGRQLPFKLFALALRFFRLHHIAQKRNDEFVAKKIQLVTVVYTSKLLDMARLGVIPKAS